MTARIVTLTLNPALDIACSAPAVVPTHKIRTTDERYDAGGGGINVARVVHALGGDAHALIMTGDVTGRLIEEMLDAGHISWQAVPIAGRTRIALNVHDASDGSEYRFVPEGPDVSEAEWRAALAALETIEADWIVASGSLPRGVPADFYARAAGIAARRGQRFALDTSGPALMASVGQGVSLLKLSLGECAFLTGGKLEGAAAQDAALAGLIAAGAADMIAISLGPNGAVLGTREKIIRRPAIAVQARSTVGAGDSFLAGLVLALARGLAPEAALTYALAAGAAAVTQYGTAQIDPATVEALFQKAIRTPC